MNKNRPIVLLSPPPSDPSQPYSSLPTLTGYLRSQGFRVIQKDLGIELLKELLTPSMLIEARIIAIHKAKSINLPKEEKYLERFYGIIGLSDYIIEHVDEAKKLMQDKKHFYDIKRYHWAAAILKLACDLVSLPYHPTCLKPSNYETEVKLSFQDLLEATSRRTDNLFFELFEQKVVPQILEMKPLLVGISTTYHFQIVPSFTLSRLIKSAAPELHVNIGGAIIHDMESHLLNDLTCFQFADSFVVGEGETALLTLARDLLSGEEPRSVPNLISKINDRPYAYNLRWYEDIMSLPCPDFDGLELEQYLSPEPVLLLSSTRGCYYGKCAFCDVSKNTRAVYRKMESKRLIANIIELHQKYGAKHFFFCDDAMPPANMLEIARLVKDRLHDITWQAEVRFEKTMTSEFLSTLKKGGCRQLLFGFESASQRVLNAMNKNNSAENDIQILKACAANGIAVNLQTIFGFPTETCEEAWETVDFLINNERNIASFGCGIFSLDKDTSVYKEPQRYYISNISAKEERLICSHNYVPLSGMTLADMKREYELAMEKLIPIYETRTFYLSTAVGAHSLLQFSNYEYDTIYQMWKEMDAPHWLDSPDMDNLILIVSPTLLFSHPLDQAHSFDHQVICSQTGYQYYLSSSEQKFLDLFDGKHTVAEITSLWVTEQSQELNTQVLLLAHAFAMIREYLRTGLVRGVKG
jgi:radical SAM superfamily enzyme YgiQ (UPF0313 family)